MDKRDRNRATLTRYVELLERVGRAEVAAVDGADEIDKRLLNELIAAGLVSDAAWEAGPMRVVSHLVLTPHGASALTDWTDHLRQQRWTFRAWETFGRLLWLLVGALAASITDLLGLVHGCP